MRHHHSHGLIRVHNRMTGDQARGTLMGKTVCSFLRLGRPFPTESRCLTFNINLLTYQGPAPRPARPLASNLSKLRVQFSYSIAGL